MITSGITQKELVNWGGTEVFNQALAIVNSGDAIEVKYDDDVPSISGKILSPSGYPMPVSLTLKPGGRIESHCPCRTNRQYGMVCPHVVAIGIVQMVNEMNAAEEVARNEAQSARCMKDDAVEPAADDFIEVEMKPKFSAYVSGSRRSLSIEVDAHYDVIDIPACSPQAERTIWLEDPKDPLIRRTRSLKSERAAYDSLDRWGFERGYREGDLKLYLSDPQKVLNFLGAGLPDLRRRGWFVDLSDSLSDLVDSMMSILPVVTIRDAANGAFDVSYQFEAQGDTVSPIEIQAALNRHDGCILRDGKVFLLDNTAIELMHGVFADCATSQNGAPVGWFRVSEVHAAYVKSSLDLLGDCIDVDDTAATRWRETAILRNRDGNAKFEPVALGKLDKILRPYQKQGVYWMKFLENSGLSGLLADEMGLGKTLQTLTWLSLGRHDLPDLIVCPTSLVRNWEAEARKFTPWMKTLVISGLGRAQDFARIDRTDIVITSYALLQRDFEAAYLGKHFGAVVLDEAQHIKNRDTKNAKYVKLLESKRRLVLTGTPVENSVADIWSIFDFLMPGYLGDYESFRLGYEIPISEGGADAETAQARLKRKLHPFILRRLKESVAKDLPDKIIKVSYCPMDADSEREYGEALAKTRRQAGDAIKSKGLAKSRFEILAMLMKLRQIASKAKLDAFIEQLRSAIEGGHRILVFSQFVKMLTLIAERLRDEGISFSYLDGSTKDRIGEVNRFNRNPDIPVFLISLMAGGTGLNLTGADMVMHYDPWWNPAVEDQATDRAHRIGQTQKVYVMKMIASGTIEEKVLALQRKKQAVIAATVSSSDGEVMERLTAEDIAELLT